MKMVQTEFEGMPKKPRPTKEDPEVKEEFKKRVIAVLDKVVPDEDEGNEEVADYLIKQMTDYHEIDGYRLAKSIDEEYYMNLDFEVAEALHELHWELGSVYDNAVREWVKEFDIKIPFSIGDKALIQVDSNQEAEGEVVKFYEDLAKVCIFCSKMGHVRTGSGSYGRIMNCEDVKIIEEKTAVSD
ncbi:hypothetical protein KAR91_71820 [Candidatus Pacearchaeota archaeon]|nr:hypothetical protein [Candidatus Pacearchaeota archaeon]